MRFPKGARVYVKGHKREGIRRVAGIYRDIRGGRLLDRRVCGFVSWNINDLIPAGKKTRK